MKRSVRKRWKRACLMVNTNRDVSCHPWFDFAFELVAPVDWNIRGAAASLALDGLDISELP